MWEVLAGLFDVLSGGRPRREAFELRSAVAPPGSAAQRADFSHCWMLQNAAVKNGAYDVTFAWRRGPDGKSGGRIDLGTLPLLRTVPLDGIAWPSQRPSVSAQVTWTESDGSRRKVLVSLDST